MILFYVKLVWFTKSAKCVVLGGEKPGETQLLSTCFLGWRCSGVLCVPSGFGSELLVFALERVELKQVLLSVGLNP